MADQETLYARWLSGELTNIEIKSLKDSGEWSELEAIIRASDRLSLPRYDKEKAFAQLKPQKTKTIAFPLKTPWITGIAASLLVLLGAYLLLRPDTTKISAPFAQNQSFSFEDQSKVILNDGSSVSFDKGSWSSERKVSLTGEAMFQVEKGSPFIIETKNGSVTVLGTSFNVRSWGEHLYVECYSGRVQVENNNQSAILSLGESVNIIKGEMKQKDAITHQQPLWSSGTSKFYEESLENVFDEIERQYDIQIKRVETNKSFSGAFTHSDLNLALEQVCKPMGLQYNINIEKNIVTVSK